MEENIQTPEVDTAPQDQPEGEATAAAETTQEAETATDTTPEVGEADNVQQPITIPIQYKHEARGADAGGSAGLCAEGASL